MRKRVKALALLRQVGERGCHSGLKLGCRFGVIAPSNLVFASGENEGLFGSKTPVFRGFPHLLSEFFTRKQQTSFRPWFGHAFPPFHGLVLPKNMDRLAVAHLWHISGDCRHIASF
jgi:hypothetical protein